MIYLDNAATSFPKPPGVAEAMLQALQIGASPARGSHAQALAADRLLFESRMLLATFIGVDTPERVVFAKNATEALNVALFGLLSPGDEVLSTDVEHNAVWRPLRALGALGVRHATVAADADGVVPADRFIAAIGPRTKLVVLVHASNVLGGIHDVAPIAAAAHRRGALVLLDAAQTLGELEIDVGALGVDLLAAPGHKCLLGPPGTGLLYVGPGVDPLRPLLFGGTGGQSEREDQPEDLPDRLESGTANLPGIAGLGAALRYLEGRGAALRMELAERTQELAHGLAQIPGVRLLGPAAGVARAALCSFTVAGIGVGQVAQMLDERGIAARTGLHCAPRAHAKAGTLASGAVRLSPGPFTTREDIRSALDAVEEIARCRII